MYLHFCILINMNLEDDYIQFYEKKYNQLLRKIGKKDIKIEYLTGSDIPESFNSNDKDDLFYAKITHFPTKISTVHGARPLIFLKWGLLKHIDRELKSREKSTIWNYIYLVFIYLLLLLFAGHFFRGDITRPSSIDDSLDVFLLALLSFTFLFFFSMFITGLKIFYRDIIIGIIGVFIIFGFAKKISIDFDNKFYENKREEKEQRSNEEKIKFDAAVEGLNDFIKQDSVLDIVAIYKLGIKYPHQYPKTFDSITPDKSIVAKPFKGIPLKVGYIANAHFKLGELYQEKRKFSESIYYYNKAIEIDSTVNEYHLRLEKVKKQREYSEGYNYDKAIKMDSIARTRFDNL